MTRNSLGAKRLGKADLINIIGYLDAAATKIYPRDMERTYPSDISPQRREQMRSQLCREFGKEVGEIIFSFRREDHEEVIDDIQAGKTSFRAILREVPPFTYVRSDLQRLDNALMQLPAGLRAEYGQEAIQAIQKVREMIQATSGKLDRKEFGDVNAFRLAKAAARAYQQMIIFLESRIRNSAASPPPVKDTEPEKGRRK